MQQLDRFGVSLSAADGAAIGGYDAAVWSLLTFSGDPVAAADRAIAADPRLPMGHVLRGLLCILGTEKSQLPGARAAVDAGLKIGGLSRREGMHLAAIETWMRGEFVAACAVWEDILVEEPRDALAMFAAHQGDFLLGRSGELRDRVARRLPQIDGGSPLQSLYLGMYAFGLEEMGEYAAAEDCGRRALASCRRDAWAVHAVAHACEMTNQIDSGRRWLAQTMPDWSMDCFLAVHLWWHAGLFLLDAQRIDDAVDMYDQRIRREGTAVTMELLDASALLWRLTLQGVDVAGRWERLATAWEPLLAEGWYAFNDMHAMMAFAGARRFDLARRLLETLRSAATATGDNAAMTREIGLPVSQALLAYAEGRFGDAIAHLLPVRPIAARAGGSHAQRDVLAQTLLAAALHGGRRALARALFNERLQAKPHSLLNLAWQQRLQAVRGPAA